MPPSSQGDINSLLISSFTPDKVLRVSLDDRPICKYIPMTGVGALNSAYDALQKIIFNLTPAEQKLIYYILSTCDLKTNKKTLIPLPDPNKSRERSKLLKLLIDKKIIKKIKVREYLINPKFLVPHPDFRDAIIAHWESLP